MICDRIDLPTPKEALPGRAEPIPTGEFHFENGTRLKGPYPPDSLIAEFGMGCFWGVEKLFWEQPGVLTTAAGYSGGYTPNPTYEEVCTGLTGHAETVLVVFYPSIISYSDLLRIFWENHDPTQGMRQGEDVGTQYRSTIYTRGEDQSSLAKASRDSYQAALDAMKLGLICTEIAKAGEFYFAEEFHQQYLERNPGKFCLTGGTGVSCPALSLGSMA